MEIGTIIGTAVLLAIAIFAVMKPFVGRSLGSIFTSLEQKNRDELLTSYERVLSTIRDLDEDYNTGKLDAATYQSERSYWTEQGITLLQQLEPQEEATKKSAKPKQADELDDEVEKAIAAYRKAKA